MSVAGKHVVVTGGGTGVGLACAQAFSKEGAFVTIMGRGEPALKATGLPYQCCDVTDAASVKLAFDAARAAQGRVDIVIANAGAAESIPFSKMSQDDLNRLMAVNVTGVFNTWQAGLGDMLETGAGRMIAIASVAGLRGYPYITGYCASKHAVIGMTRALAIELATKGITVNAICPGYVETPMLQRSVMNVMEKTGLNEAEATRHFLKTNPQGRFIQAEEVAQTALWLCSGAAVSVNGHALSMTGGEV